MGPGIVLTSSASNSPLRRTAEVATVADRPTMCGNNLLRRSLLEQWLSESASVQERAT